MSKQNETTTNIRFTTLVNPNLLSQIKFVSYLTNQKLYESINKAMELMIKDFEISHSTKIDTLINLQQTPTIEISVDDTIELEEDNNDTKSTSKK